MIRSWMPVTTLAMLLHQTMNTHVMNTLQCYTVLNGSIWILFHPCNMLHHRPQGSSTPAKAVLWSQVNVLDTYNATDRQYTLSEHTAAIYNRLIHAWFQLNTLDPCFGLGSSLIDRRTLTVNSDLQWKLKSSTCIRAVSSTRVSSPINNIADVMSVQFGTADY